MRLAGQICTVAAVILSSALSAESVPAQDSPPVRVSRDSAGAIDYFAGDNTVNRPNIVVDITAGTVAFRLSPQSTLRGSIVARKAYTRTTWDRQRGASLVWAQRWW